MLFYFRVSLFVSRSWTLVLYKLGDTSVMFLKLFYCVALHRFLSLYLYHFLRYFYAHQAEFSGIVSEDAACFYFVFFISMLVVHDVMIHCPQSYCSFADTIEDGTSLPSSHSQHIYVHSFSTFRSLLDGRSDNISNPCIGKK